MRLISRSCAPIEPSGGAPDKPRAMRLMNRSVSQARFAANQGAEVLPNSGFAPNKPILQSKMRLISRQSADEAKCFLHHPSTLPPLADARQLEARIRVIKATASDHGHYLLSLFVLVQAEGVLG